jgi:predicted enzyme related to lactoylglutathione lyase
MATATGVQRGFVWYELNTTDPKAAQRFYTTLLEWGLQDFNPANAGANEPYVMWTRDNKPFGGVMRLPDEARKMGAPPHWLAYVGVGTAVDATVEQAQKLGARVYVPPTDIPGGGRFAVLADPQGAVFGVVGSAQPTPEPVESVEPQVGQFAWHELSTTDHAAAFRFYNTLFGWEKGEPFDMGPMGTYQMFGRRGRTLGGMYNKPPQVPAPPHWMLYVRVPDVDKAAERVKAVGGRIIHGPADVPGGDRIVQCIDPQGAAFALVRTKSA